MNYKLSTFGDISGTQIYFQLVGTGIDAVLNEEDALAFKLAFGYAFLHPTNEEANFRYIPG